MIKKRVGLILLCLLVSASLYGRDIEYNQSVFLETAPRVEGSESEQRALRFITSELQRIGVPYETESFAHYIENYSRSQNIYAFIEGESATTVVLAASTNRRSSYSLSLLLSLIEQYRIAPPRANIVFAFLGADYWNEEYLSIGSALLLESLSSLSIDALLYLNLDADPEVMEIDIGNSAIIADRALVEGMLGSARAVDQRVAIPLFWHTITGGRFRILHRGIDLAPTPTHYFLQQGIPALTLSTTQQRAVPELYGAPTLIEEFIATFDDGAPTNDINYFAFPLLGRFHTIPESSTVIILVILASLVCAVTYLSKRHVQENYFLLAKRGWPLLILHLVALASALHSSQFVVEGIFFLLPLMDVWMELPILALVLKMLIARPLYIMFQAIVIRLYPGSNPELYDGLTFAASGILQVTALIDIFFATVAMWTLLCARCLIFTRTRYKIALFVPAVSVVVVYLLIYISRASSDFFALVIFSDFVWDLILAMIIVPYSFMYLRLRSAGIRIINTTAFVVSTAGVAAAIILFFALYDPFIRALPVNITLEEHVDHTLQSHAVRYKSNFDRNSGTTLIVDDRADTITLDPSAHEKEIELAHNEYYTIDYDILTNNLERIYIITIDGERDIESLELFLASDRPIDILSASIPHQNITADAVALYAGRNPSLPLFIQFSLESSFTSPVTLEMIVRNTTPFAAVEVTQARDSEYNRDVTVDTDATAIVRYTLE